jgi:hypothetical protein
LDWMSRSVLALPLESWNRSAEVASSYRSLFRNTFPFLCLFFFLLYHFLLLFGTKELIDILFSQ